MLVNNLDSVTANKEITNEHKNSKSMQTGLQKKKNSVKKI
jgi:hypothetical protein